MQKIQSVVDMTKPRVCMEPTAKENEDENKRKDGIWTSENSQGKMINQNKREEANIQNYFSMPYGSTKYSIVNKIDCILFLWNLGIWNEKILSFFLKKRLMRRKWSNFYDFEKNAYQRGYMNPIPR